MSQNGKENTGLDDKIFSTVNIGNLEQMDPSLEQNHDGASSYENVNAKLLVQGQVENPQMVKLEFTSEADLFFHYSVIESIESFENLKTKQELTLQFEGFIGLLIKLLNNLQHSNTQHFATMSLYPNGRAKIDFMQNLHYKYINLLTLELSSSDEEVIRESITFRYNLIKAKMMYLQSNFKQFSQLVKTKNPSLLVQLEKQFKKTGYGPQIQALENSMKHSNFMQNSFKKQINQLSITHQKQIISNSNYGYFNYQILSVNLCQISYTCYSGKSFNNALLLGNNIVFCTKSSYNSNFTISLTYDII